MDKHTLYRFFEGTTTSGEDRKVVEWVDENPDNIHTFIARRRIYETILLGSETGDNSGAVAENTKPARRNIPRWTRELMRTAAAVILTAGIGAYFYLQSERRMDVVDNTISVPVGQQLDIVLSDGTEVTMNGSSTITFPPIFSKSERRVQLSGEAYFAVTHDADHPFVVETSKYDIEVLGTEFNVMAYPESDEFVASLVEGRVKVTDNADAGNFVELSPRQEARLSGGKLIVGKMPEYEKFLWRDGLIDFYHASLPYMMDLFEKYYGVRMVYNADELPKMAFSGKIRISEGIDHALWVLQQNAMFEYEKDNNTNTITIKTMEPME
jgi:ferric-dicitrate binding protein FerR (iron transport regulator)